MYTSYKTNNNQIQHHHHHTQHLSLLNQLIIRISTIYSYLSLSLIRIGSIALIGIVEGEEFSLTFGDKYLTKIILLFAVLVLLYYVHYYYILQWTCPHPIIMTFSM